METSVPFLKPDWGKRNPGRTKNISSKEAGKLFLAVKPQKWKRTQRSQDLFPTMCEECRKEKSEGIGGPSGD